MSLTLTPAAADLLSKSIEVSPLSEGTGLRIWGEMTDEKMLLRCVFSEGPTQVDEVVTEGEARLFLDPSVSEVMSDKTLAIQKHGAEVSLVLIDDWSADEDYLID